MDFFGPIIRSRRGNIAVLVILDGFSKFVAMYPVRRITSEIVKGERIVAGEGFGRIHSTTVFIEI
jgi:hypothetical protein